MEVSLIETKALEFIDGCFYIRIGKFDTTKFKSDMKKSMNFFNRIKDRHDFLIAVRKEMKRFTNPDEANNYGLDEYTVRDALFIIEQEIEVIAGKRERLLKESDEFTGAEQAELFTKINTILEELKKTNLGQEVLFNEINELKDYIALGKKNFRQLATGKIAEMVASGVVDRTVGNQLYQSLAEGAKFLSKLIDTTL